MENTFPIANLLGKFDAKEVAAINLERQKRLDARTKEAPKPLELIVYANADEARAARLNFEVQPDAEDILRVEYAEQNELFEIETQLLAILEHGVRKMSKLDAEHAKKKILGYDTKERELPGVLTTKVHVPGSLERVREKLADIESRLPRLQAEAARYANMKASLAPWPWVRINRERNNELDQEQILNGKMPHPRGGRSMAGYTIQP
jgi:hypothetical protein